MKKILLVMAVLIMLFSIKETISTQYISKREKDTILSTQIGILEIPKLSLKREIFEGSSLEVLNHDYIGHIKESYFDFENTIILVGHNDTIFKSIHTLKKQDEIILNIQREFQKYCVFLNTEIKQDDYTYFKDNGAILILITCTSDQDKRRIILAKNCM